MSNSILKQLVFTLTCLTLIMVFSNKAHADAPSFTYVEADYIAAGDFEISKRDLSANVDLEGFALTGSLELGIFFFQASRFELDSDDLIVDIKDNISTVAAGLTFALPRTSVYGMVRARRDELSARGFGFNENETGNSIGLEGGVRVNLTDRIELNANVGSPALDEGWSYGAGAQFFLMDNLGITLKFNSLEVEDGDLTGKFDTTSVGLRFSF